jgi:hypothetical protein
MTEGLTVDDRWRGVKARNIQTVLPKECWLWLSRPDVARQSAERQAREYMLIKNTEDEQSLL